MNKIYALGQTQLSCMLIVLATGFILSTVIVAIQARFTSIRLKT